MTGCEGATTTTSSTPAARAVTAPISTEDGYGARPPGAYTAARRTGTSRSRTEWPCSSVTAVSAPSPAAATASMLAAASFSARRTSGSSASSAASRRGWGTRPQYPSPKRCSYSATAAFPRRRTSSTIAATASATEAAAGTVARTSAATSAASATVQLRRIADPREQLVDLRGLELVRDRVGDQAGRRGPQLLAHDQPVLAQRRAGGGEVDDPLDQPGQRGQLDRALDLDDLRLAPGALEVAGGGARVLRRDAHHSEPAQRLGGGVVAVDGREHHHAAPVAEVGKLVDLALHLLGEHVLAGDAEVGGARLDVGGHVGGPHRDDPDLGEQQAAVVVAHDCGLDAERVQEIQGLPHQRPARHRHGQPVQAHRTPRGPSAVSPLKPIARPRGPSAVSALMPTSPLARPLRRGRCAAARRSAPTRTPA